MKMMNFIQNPSAKTTIELAAKGQRTETLAAMIAMVKEARAHGRGVEARALMGVINKFNTLERVSGVYATSTARKEYNRFREEVEVRGGNNMELESILETLRETIGYLYADRDTRDIGLLEGLAADIQRDIEGSRAQEAE